MFATYILSLALLGLSGMLIDIHRRSWHRQQTQEDLSERDLKYAHRQFRRRMMASATIGVVGALIAIRPIVPREPIWMACYLGLMLLCCLWILCAGMIDAAAGALQYRHSRRQQIASQLKLTQELYEAAKKTESAKK